MVLRVKGMREWMDNADCTLISDRGSGLVPAVGECLSLTRHVWCTDHLYRNTKDNSKEFHEGYWRKIVYAVTPSDFKDAIEALQNVVPKAAEYVGKIAPETYNLDACCTAGIRKWGRSASTLVEGENARFKAAKYRAGSPIGALAGCLIIQLDVLTRMAKAASAMLDEQILVKLAGEKLDKEHEKARRCVVKETSEPYVWIVTDASKGDDVKQRTVDLSEPFSRHGSCVKCHQEMCPCKHLLAAAYAAKKKHGAFLPGVSTSEAFIKAVHHKAYYAQSLREAVANKAVKLADTELLLPDGKTKPTIAYSKAERKKGKLQVRMPSRGEHPSSATGAAHVHALPPPASPSTSLPAPPPLPSQIRAALPPPLAPPERRVTRSSTKQ